MKKALPLIAILLVLSAVLGWLRAGTSAGIRPAEVDGWNAMMTADISDADYAKISARIKNTKLLPLSLIAETRLAEAQTGAATLTAGDTPPFPELLAVSEVNKTHYAHLRGGEDTLIKVKTGDTLESGWVIKTVDRRQVIAVFDADELVVPAVGYLKDAFTRPEEDSDEDTNKAAAQTGGGD